MDLLSEYEAAKSKVELIHATQALQPVLGAHDTWSPRSCSSLLAGDLLTSRSLRTMFLEEFIIIGKESMNMLSTIGLSLCVQAGRFMGVRPTCCVIYSIQRFFFVNL